MSQSQFPLQSLPVSNKAEEEVGYQYEEVFNLAKRDMDFFAGLCLPTVYKYPFPDLYIQFWSLITSILYKERDFSQLALGLPRVS